MPKPSPTSPSPAQDLARRFWASANAGDWAAFADLLSPDLVYEVPQTRERIVGRALFVEFFRSWPEAWRVDLRRCFGEDEQAVAEIDFITERETVTGLAFFELRQGRIAHITDYWPSDYEPPQRVVAGVQRY